MYERMLNKQKEPSPAELTAYCGQQGERFSQLNQWLTQTHGTAQQVVFPYGNGYGWGIAHRKKRKLICNVFAEDGAFTVMLRLSNAQFEQVYDGLQKTTQERIDHKYPCGDGGWIHCRVASQGDLEDVQRLLSQKLQ